MNKDNLRKELETFQEQFNDKVLEWALEEIKKVCEEYKIEVQDYGIMGISDIDGNGWFENEHPKWDEVQSKLWEIERYLNEELQYKSLAYEYSVDRKFIQ